MHRRLLIDDELHDRLSPEGAPKLATEHRCHYETEVVETASIFLRESDSRTRRDDFASAEEMVPCVGADRGFDVGALAVAKFASVADRTSFVAFDPPFPGDISTRAPGQAMSAMSNSLAGDAASTSLLRTQTRHGFSYVGSLDHGILQSPAAPFQVLFKASSCRIDWESDHEV
jgi:hypothetical protein